MSYTWWEAMQMMLREVTSLARDSSNTCTTFLSGWRSRPAVWDLQTQSKNFITIPAAAAVIVYYQKIRWSVPAHNIRSTCGHYNRKDISSALQPHLHGLCSWHPQCPHDLPPSHQEQVQLEGHDNQAGGQGVLHGQGYQGVWHRGQKILTSHQENKDCHHSSWEWLLFFKHK